MRSNIQKKKKHTKFLPILLEPHSNLDNDGYTTLVSQTKAPKTLCVFQLGSGLFIHKCKCKWPKKKCIWKLPVKSGDLKNLHLYVEQVAFRTSTRTYRPVWSYFRPPYTQIYLEVAPLPCQATPTHASYWLAWPHASSCTATLVSGTLIAVLKQHVLFPILKLQCWKQDFFFFVCDWCSFLGFFSFHFDQLLLRSASLCCLGIKAACLSREQMVGPNGALWHA